MYGASACSGPRHASPREVGWSVDEPGCAEQPVGMLSPTQTFGLRLFSALTQRVHR